MLTVAGCRDAGRGNVAADTAARPPAVASPAAAAVVSAGTDTTTSLHPHAGAPPALVLGATTVSLYSSSLTEVGAAFGPAAVVDDTTGDFRKIDACYVAGTGVDRVTVLLSAADFMSDTVTTEQAMAKLPVKRASVTRGDLIAPRSTAPKRCVPLSVSPSLIHWSNGLRLGMTRAEAEQLLGPPQKGDGTEWVYTYDAPHFQQVSIDRTTGKEVAMDVAVTVGMRVRYENGVATRIDAWYATEPNSVG